MTATPPTQTPDRDEPAGPVALRWPAIDPGQTRRLTDDTGIFQHALFATPDPRHGYCIDDNARALIAALRLAQLQGHDEAVLSLHRYLMFVVYAFNPDAVPGRFRNFMGYDRRWLEDTGSPDSQGRALWALGLTAAHAPTPDLRDLAATIFKEALPGVTDADQLEHMPHMRTRAFAILGIERFLHAVPDHAPAAEALPRLARQLHDHLNAHRSDGWPWWEDIVTYDNAKLPHALLRAGHALRQPDFLADGFLTLRWLIEQQTSRNDDGTPRLSVIGNDGWLPQNQNRAAFDQQPLEAYALVDACLDAARFAKKHSDLHENPDHWEQQAWTCFTWFLGNNDARRTLIDPHTGGCCDGLHPGGVNRNQGAESTLAYLLSVLELHRYEAQHPGQLTALAQP